MQNIGPLWIKDVAQNPTHFTCFIEQQHKQFRLAGVHCWVYIEEGFVLFFNVFSIFIYLNVSLFAFYSVQNQQRHRRDPSHLRDCDKTVCKWLVQHIIGGGGGVITSGVTIQYCIDLFGITTPRLAISRSL